MHGKTGVSESRTTIDRVVLQRDGSLLAKEDYEWPFRLQVPKDTIPTARSGKTSVVWRLKGVLARRMRPDLVIERQVQVYTPPRPTGSPLKGSQTDRDFGR